MTGNLRSVPFKVSPRYPGLDFSSKGKILLHVKLNFLLLGRDNLSSAGGLGMLTSDLETPVVSETSVGTDLLKALEILTELVVELVDKQVRVSAVSEVTLSVQEPRGDLVLARVLDDGHNSLKLFDSKLTSSLGKIDISLLADQVGVTTTNTSDLGQGVHDLDLTIDVGAEETTDVSKCDANRESIWFGVVLIVRSRVAKSKGYSRNQIKMSVSNYRPFSKSS